MTTVLLVSVMVFFGFSGWQAYAAERKQEEPPLVRFARMVSRNDPETVALAAALAEDKQKAWETEAFRDTVGSEFDPEDLNSATAILWFINSNKRQFPFVAYFDWKEGGTDVTNALDGMLAHEGLSGPTPEERGQILKEAEENYSKYTAIPILAARYDRYFRIKDYTLAHIATNSDAYFFIVLPPETAQCWLNTAMPKEEKFKPADMPLVQQAIDQSEEFIKDKIPDMLPLLAPRGRKPRDIPASACLPAR